MKREAKITNIYDDTIIEWWRNEAIPELDDSECHELMSMWIGSEEDVESRLSEDACDTPREWLMSEICSDEIYSSCFSSTSNPYVLDIIHCADDVDILGRMYEKAVNATTSVPKCWAEFWYWSDCGKIANDRFKYYGQELKDDFFVKQCLRDPQFAETLYAYDTEGIEAECDGLTVEELGWVRLLYAEHATQRCILAYSVFKDYLCKSFL